MKAPAVSVQAVPRRQGGIESDQPGTARAPMTLVVVNNSARALTHLRLAVDPGSGFTAAATPTFPETLAPFATFTGSLTLAPPPRIAYGKHDVVLTLQYEWGDTARFTSAQPVTVSVDIKRMFDEEAKAMPGGTAALFYLLLPLFPAFFAYQIVDRLRRGDGFQVPVFDKDYLLPAFGIGLLVNYLLGARYSRTDVLIAAALIGASWPAARWWWEAFQRRRWGFKTTDTLETYLRKALLSRRRYHGDLWMTAKAGGEIWSGARLEQPDGRPVLGARLSITPVYADGDSEVEKEQRFLRLKVLADVTAGPATLEERIAVCNEIKEGRATLDTFEKVHRGDALYDYLVAAEELVGFESQKAKRQTFVEARR